MREIDYQEFSRKLHGRSTEGFHKRVPTDVTFELTYRCNNLCVHCYCNLPENDLSAAYSELTLDEIFSLLDELKDLGCLWLLLTGGEVLLRNDFREIYIAAKQRGFLVSVFTNATLVTDEIIDMFRAYPPFVVEVTMYGATKTTYEKVSGVPGSFECYQKGLHKLLNARVPLKLKAVALTVNRDEIIAMGHQAEEFGCDFRFDPLIQRRIHGSQRSGPTKYRLTPDEVVALEMQFPKLMEGHQTYCDHKSTKNVNYDSLIPCGAGQFSLHISPDGTVLPCSMLFDEGTSIRKKLLLDIWEKDFQILKERKKDFILPCDRCTIQALCSQCTGWSLVEHGTCVSEVEYLCEIAKKREALFPFLKRSVNE